MNCGVGLLVPIKLNDFDERVDIKVETDLLLYSYHSICILFFSPYSMSIVMKKEKADSSFY